MFTASTPSQDGLNHIFHPHLGTRAPGVFSVCISTVVTATAPEEKDTFTFNLSGKEVKQNVVIKVQATFSTQKNWVWKGVERRRSWNQMFLHHETHFRHKHTYKQLYKHEPIDAHVHKSVIATEQSARAACVLADVCAERNVPIDWLRSTCLW